MICVTKVCSVSRTFWTVASSGQTSINWSHKTVELIFAIGFQTAFIRSTHHGQISEPRRVSWAPMIGPKLPRTGHTLACQHHRLLPKSVVNLIKCRHDCSRFWLFHVKQCFWPILEQNEIVEQYSGFRKAKCLRACFWPSRQRASSCGIDQIEGIRRHWRHAR